MPTKSEIIGTVKIKMEDGTFVDLLDPISLEEITTFVEQYEFVKVVRCGECKFRDPEDKKCDCGHGILWQLPRDDNWFCADGEKRDE